jgi:beta-glucosidase
VDRSVIEAGDDVTVTLTVANTGRPAGPDVVQIYRRGRSGVVLRPRRELAGFAKVRLPPGESRTGGVTVPAQVFAFYDVRAGDWRILSGAYELEVGRSSTDVVDTVTVVVKGGVGTAAEPTDAPVDIVNGRPGRAAARASAAARRPPCGAGDSAGSKPPYAS